MKRLNNRNPKCIGKYDPTRSYHVEVHNLRTDLKLKEDYKTNYINNDRTNKRPTESNLIPRKRFKPQPLVSPPTSSQNYNPCTNLLHNPWMPNNFTVPNILNMYSSPECLQSNVPIDPSFGFINAIPNDKIGKSYKSNYTEIENRTDQSQLSTFNNIGNKSHNQNFLPIYNTIINENFNNEESIISNECGEIFINTNPDNQTIYNNANYLANQNLWWMRNRSNIQASISHISDIKQCNKENDYFPIQGYMESKKDFNIQPSASDIYNVQPFNAKADYLTNQNLHRSNIQPTSDVYAIQQFNRKADYFTKPNHDKSYIQPSTSYREADYPANQDYKWMENSSYVQPSLSAINNFEPFSPRVESLTDKHSRGSNSRVSTSNIDDDHQFNRGVDYLTNQNLWWLENMCNAPLSALKTSSTSGNEQDEINSYNMDITDMPGVKLPKSRIPNFFIPPCNIEYTEVLHPKQQPTKEMKLRLENALEIILYTTKDTKYTAATIKQKLVHDQEFHRYIKPIIRQRIRKVLRGKVVGSSQDIVDCYREKYPKETDCNLAKAFTDCTSFTDGNAVRDLIKSDDPEDYFHLNMKRLINTKINKLFTLIEKRYENADKELHHLFEKTDDKDQDEGFFEKVMSLMIESHLPKLLPQFKNEIVNMIYHKEVCQAIKLDVLKKH